MLLPQILILLFASGELRAEDPYRSMAKAVSKAAKARQVETISVIPLKALDSEDGLGGRVVTERLLADMMGNDGLQVSEGAENREARGPSRGGELDPGVFEGILRQFQIQDMEMADTPYERERRSQLRDALKEHQVAAARTARLAERAQVRASGGLLTGVLVPLADGKVEVHVRLLDGEGEVLTSASARVSKDWGTPTKGAVGVPTAGGAAGAAAVLAWLLARMSRA